MMLLQTIVSVEVPRFPLVRLTYEDGFVAILDFASKIAWGDAMIPLRDPQIFATAHVGSNGSSVEWIGPEAEQIDFCADALRMEAEEALRAPAAE